MSQDRAFAAWEDLRRRVEALESRLPVPVFEPCACKEVTLARGQLEKVTDSRYRRTTHYRECCNRVSPIPKPAPVPEWRRLVNIERDNIGESDAGALSDVLRYLGDLSSKTLDEHPCYEPSATLARIIAVAEGQVGDGWQADPDRARLHAGVDVVTSLLNRITKWPIGSPPIIDWEDLGHGAAEWLRDLIVEQS